MPRRIKITLIRSPIGYAKDQKATVQALGLRRLHQSVVRPDESAVRGMVRKVQHLLTVECLEDGDAT